MEIITTGIAILSIIGAILTITASNPIVSVFWLVTTFVNAAVILLMQGCEFISILIIIVYVGAIAILFLFVVMMLNIKKVEIQENATKYIPAGIMIGIEFANKIQEKLGLGTHEGGKRWEGMERAQEIVVKTNTNAEAMGEILYTEYAVYLMVAGVILMIAMIGAIILTIQHQQEIKRQDIFAQIATSYEKTVSTRP